MYENVIELEKLTIKQEIAIKALLTTANTTEAAQKSGVTTTTLYRWLKQPEFNKCISLIREQAVRGTINKIQLMSGEALEVLHNTMKAKNTSNTLKVNVAKIILELSLKGYEQDNIINKNCKGVKGFIFIGKDELVD